MKKWLNWIALVVIFSVACGFLSNWQFSRREAKLAAIALITSNYSMPAVPIGDLVKHGDFSVPEQNWRSVSVSGKYIPESSLLVRNRPNNGQPGFEQLVAFQTSEYGVVFVSRGWLPTGDLQDSPDNIPNVSDATIVLEAKIMSAEPELSRSAPKGQVASINIRVIQAKTGLETTFKNSYLRMIDESPSASVALTPMPKPSVDEGNNLSYALQWILFAVMAVLALIWRIRKDREIALGMVAKPRKRSKADFDADYEDSITRAK